MAWNWTASTKRERSQENGFEVASDFINRFWEHICQGGLGAWLYNCCCGVRFAGEPPVVNIRNLLNKQEFQRKIESEYEMNCSRFHYDLTMRVYVTWIGVIQILIYIYIYVRVCVIYIFFYKLCVIYIILIILYKFYTPYLSMNIIKKELSCS